MHSKKIMVLVGCYPKNNKKEENKIPILIRLKNMEDAKFID